MRGVVRISVLLPFRNAAATVGAAVRSILEQDERDFELLAIDDGSTDDSIARVRSEVGEDARVTVLVDGHQRGLAARLNELMDAAQGELFARMDADDVSHPARLRLQRAAFESTTAPDLLGTAVVVLQGDEPLGTRTHPLDHASIVAHAWRGIPIAHPTFMGRAQWFRRHRYDTRFERTQDQELLLRTRGSSRFANLAEPLLAYRASPSVQTARRARCARRQAVREHVGIGASLALGVRDALARFSPARHIAGLVPFTEAERARWRALAESGRWPAPISAL